MIVTVKLECDDEDKDVTFERHKELIIDDIKSEVGCCWHLFEIRSIEFGEVERVASQEAITIKKTKEPYGYGVYGGICPKCRNWIQSAHSYCGFCGQAVKWE